MLSSLTRGRVGGGAGGDVAEAEDGVELADVEDGAVLEDAAGGVI